MVRLHVARGPSRGFRRNTVAVTALVALLVTFSSTVAGATPTPAAQWAPKFCTAVSTFEQHLTRDGTKADAVLSGNITSLSAAKNALTTFMSRATADADAAVTALKKAGAPDAPNGSKLAAVFVKALQNARGLYASARTDAQHLPTKTLSAFESATKKITNKLNRGSTGITNSFTHVEALDTSGQVGAAVRAEPSCAFLQNR
jgi:hypothetical protein